MIPVIIPLSDRKKLIKQTVHTLLKSMLGNKNVIVLSTMYGMEIGEVKCVNGLIKSFEVRGEKWKYLARTGDDMYYSEGWLEKMLGIYKNNKDVWHVGGCRYPTHKILEEREDCYITEVASGTNMLIRRDVWDKFGPFEDGHELLEDAWFSKKIRDAGGKIAVPKDPTLVVHCGIEGHQFKGRSKDTIDYMQNLVDKVGAITG